MNSETEILAEASKEENLTMKKLLSLLLCIILIISLFSCNVEEVESTKEPTQSSEEKSNSSNNGNVKYDPLISPVVDLTKTVTGVTIISDGITKSFHDDPESVEKVCSYVNALNLQTTNENTPEEPVDDPDITIRLATKGSSDAPYEVSKIIVRIFESDKKAGISNTKWGGWIYWYDIVDYNAIKPSKFLEELFKTNPTYSIRLEIKDGKPLIPDKEIEYISVREAISSSYFRNDSDIKNIIKALEDMKFLKVEDRSGYSTNRATIYFKDNSDAVFFLTPEYLCAYNTDHTGVEHYVAEDTEMWNDFREMLGFDY